MGVDGYVQTVYPPYTGGYLDTNIFNFSYRQSFPTLITLKAIVKVATSPYFQ